jgi:hypothetical protein
MERERWPPAELAWCPLLFMTTAIPVKDSSVPTLSVEALEKGAPAGWWRSGSSS